MINSDSTMGVAVPRLDPYTRLQFRRSAVARRVAELLRADIVLGRHRGEPLPRETELIGAFAVSRNAVRDALDLLRSEGLIRRVQGAGTFVSGRKLEHRLDRLHGFVEGLDRGSARVTHEPLEAVVVPLPEPAARRLGLQPGDEAFYLERLTIVDGVAMSLKTSWVPVDLGWALVHDDLHSDFYQAVEQAFGEPIDTSNLAFEAVAASEALATLLGLAPASPILQVERLLQLGNGRVIEFGYSYHRGDRLRFVAELPRSRRTSTCRVPGGHG